MPESTYGVRPSKGELERWQGRAAAKGVGLNTWMRQAMNLVADLEAAAVRQAQVEGAATGGLAEGGLTGVTGLGVRGARVPPSSSVPVGGRRSRAGMCVHRVPAGAFCGRCD